MKKSSKILGSVALSAALVMGTAAPAFANAPDEDLLDELKVQSKEKNYATPEGSVTLAGEGVEDGASTLVTVGTYTSQISVTVPISLPLYFDTAGGSGLAPGDGVYSIKNGSTAPITVSNASYKIKDTETDNWNFGGGKYDDYTDSTPAPSSDREFGDIYVAITPTSGAATTPLELKSKSSSTTATSGTQNTMGWVIDAGQTLGFKVEPSSTKLNKSLDALSPIATITYTVKVGTSAGQKLTEDDPQNMAEILEADKVAASVVKAIFNKANVSFIDDKGAAVTTLDDSWVIVSKIEYKQSATKWNEVTDADELKADPEEGATYRVTCELTSAPVKADTEEKI